MFGYVRPVESELLVREYDFYRAVYCGVCRAMQKHTGRLSAMALTYDSVFYALVRMMLTDAPCVPVRHHCPAHACRGRECLAENEALAVTARAFAVLAYGKCLDEVADRRGFSRLKAKFAARVMRGAARRARLPSAEETMKKELASLAELEKDRCPSVDRVAECSGRMLEAFFAEGLTGDAREIAAGIGLSLGRFIAAADAAEDFEEDEKNGTYNPYRYAGDGRFTEREREQAYCALTSQLCHLETALLRLPHDRYPAAGNILKNILYLGLPKRIAFLRPTENVKGEPRP